MITTSRTVSYDTDDITTGVKNALRVDNQDDSLNGVLNPLITRALSDIELAYGYIIGTGTFIVEGYAHGGQSYRLPNCPVNTLTSVQVDGVDAVLDTDYTIEKDLNFGVWHITFMDSGNFSITYTTSVVNMPGVIQEAIESFVFNRYAMEPPYTVSVRDTLDGTPLRVWYFG